VGNDLNRPTIPTIPGIPHHPLHTMDSLPKQEPPHTACYYHSQHHIHPNRSLPPLVLRATTIPPQLQHQHLSLHASHTCTQYLIPNRLSMAARPRHFTRSSTSSYHTHSATLMGSQAQTAKAISRPTVALAGNRHTTVDPVSRRKHHRTWTGVAPAIPMATYRPQRHIPLSRTIC
jgi:hypothetical protein